MGNQIVKETVWSLESINRIIYVHCHYSISSCRNYFNVSNTQWMYKVEPIKCYEKNMKETKLSYEITVNSIQ